jgi:uncharacterized protein
MSLTRFISLRRLAALAVPGLVAPLALVAPVALATPAAAVSPDLVISQVYGGGGNSGATYTNDFIELYNRSASSVDLTGWSVQYASAAGTTWQVTSLNGSLAAGQHYLVQEAAGAGGTTPLPVPDATGSIAMSATNGKVTLVTSQTALSCGSTAGSCSSVASVKDFIGYGSASDYEGSPAPGLNNTTADLRAADGTDTDNNAADFAAGAPNPRSTGTGGAGSCTDPATPIDAVQGNGASSPILGENVPVQGVLTSNRSGPGGIGGYYLQEEAADVDADPATSEGVFVRGTPPTGTTEGDSVRVAGIVTERFGQTSIEQSAARSCGPGELPAATSVTFPLSAVSDLEAYEGMLVTFPQDLVISEYFNYDRFGETVVGVPLPGRDRFDTPTAVVEPGATAQALAAQYPLRQILLDDGRGSQNPTPAFFPGTVDTPLTADHTFRGGDTLTDVTGVLAEDFGAYRVHPTADATYDAINPRPQDPPKVGGTLRVASFNVLNYFLTLDVGDNQCGPDLDQDCRGANTPEELDRQRTKIVEAISKLDADVVGLMEMENTPGVEPAADLVAGLNAKVGAGTYAYIDTGVVGTDAIRVGMLYKPAKVQPVGDFAILDHTVDPRFLDTKNRPSLAQSFEQKSNGAQLTVAVNHLKSKGSDCNDVGDPDTGDGQGNCNLTRTAAATALAQWLKKDPTGSGDHDSLIIGDLNSYDHEDPIDALVGLGYTDMIKAFHGEFAYSYVFDGQVGYLDHGLASPTLRRQVAGAADWHINSDEPDILDYDMSFKQANEDALYQPNQFRASDHDPVLIGLDLKPGKS